MVSCVRASHVAVSKNNPYLAFESIIVEANVYVVHRIGGNRDWFEEEDIRPRGYRARKSSTGQ